MNATAREQAPRRATAAARPRARPSSTRPSSTGTRATLTSGPAAMLHSVAPGRCGGSTYATPAERPEDDLVGRAAHLPAGERVAELVERDDGEQRQVLHHVPDRRAVWPSARWIS